MKHFVKRVLALVLTVCLLAIMPFSVSAEKMLYEYPSEEEDTITAPSAMMLYMGVKPEQDVVLYEKEADTRYAPGSLMRVAMAGYAMKLINEQQLNMETVTGQYTLSLFNHYVAGTGLHVALMNFGETWKLKDLLTVSTIQTAADAAVTLATVLSGTPEAFVEGLNAFAQELGCKDSHFTNVVGLNEEGQYMSARDVVTFSRYAMQYTQVRDILELKQWTVQPVSEGKTRSWPTSNDMVRASTDVYYSYAVGGKTGGTLTEQSLMEYGSLNGYEYMAVVMGAAKKNAKDEVVNKGYADARRLIRWGLIGFEYATLARKSELVGRLEVKDSAKHQTVSLVPEKELFTVVKKGTNLDAATRKVITEKDFCTAPIEKGQQLGTLSVYLEDKLIGSVPVVAGEEAPRNFLYALWSDICGFIFSGWFLAVLIILILLAAGYLFLNIRYNRKQKRKWR